ncbi:MAG: chloride channel protein [Thioclava sp.]|nr:chloride channel protein [Thioclava sp.]|tara:strand:- start:17622 stop:19040 length:1419 start_codon:yes stop_codon:yes gene_type:complete
MPRSDDEKRYRELKAYTEEVVRQLNEIRRGHIHIESLNIKYDFPEEAISYHHWRNRIYIFIAASLIGLVAVGFASLSDTSIHLFEILYDIEPRLPFVITPLGLLLAKWLTERVFKGAEGSGIPQVIAAMTPGQSEKLLSFRAGIGKVIGTNIALIAGASVGREGPTVQIGAIIARFFSKILRAPVMYSERSLILAGGASGVSAAFNTPIAGIVFAIEELGKSFYERETSILLMSIVVSGLCALSLSGPYFYFGSTQVGLMGWEQMYAIPIGFLTGLSGGFFSLTLIKGSLWVQKQSTKKAYALTFVFGLIIAAIGYYTNGATFGTGYGEAKALLEGTSQVQHYSAFKFVVTALSYLSGVPGGIFAPTLSIGAGIGSWLTDVFHTTHSQAFVLLGMVSFFAGVIRSPITAVIIVSEMTHNHLLLLPLLMASLVAYGAARLTSKESLYHTFAMRYSPKPHPTPAGDPEKPKGDS